MTYTSVVQKRGPVTFPAFTGERVYMQGLDPSKPLPPHLERWQPTVNSMLQGVSYRDTAYLLIDQKTVQPGRPQRKGGVHIDGYWKPGLQAWKHPPGHPPWMHCITEDLEGLLLAPDVSASAAYSGAWSGEIGQGGDCSSVDLTRLSKQVLEAGSVYAGNVTMLHEGLPVTARVNRTLVRLHVPGWSPL